MSNLRDDQKAAEIVARCAEEELSGDLALRTYTTRLPGGITAVDGGDTAVGALR
jgi:hypothetical protein